MQNCVVAETLFVLATPMVIGVDSIPCACVPSKWRDTNIACVPAGHMGRDTCRNTLGHMQLYVRTHE